ncbi:MAG: tRNA pseudouridine(38-40) synthase TruA [Bacteroidota bacterium]
MNNYKLIIQYDGTNYAGWQIQSNAVTVQQKIIDAIETITKEKVNLIGSGRTDSGVHALGQSANFRTEKELDTYKFLYSLNSLLPNDISVTEMMKVGEDFHARFDAKSRSYIYLFNHRKSPFFEKYSYLYPPIAKLDVKSLNKLSSCLLGEHDFTSFSRKNSEIEDKTCTVNEIHWRQNRERTIFYITANRFLHGMVRTIVGTLLYAAEKNLDEKYLLKLFELKDRTEAEESVPAKGLFLFKVRY